MGLGLDEWIVYNVILPLLPVPLVYFGFWLLSIKRKVVEIIKDGQLCFFCTTLVAVAIRDLTNAYTTASIAWPLIGLIFILILSTFVYAVAVVGTAAGTIAEKDLSSPKRLAGASSLMVFTASVLVILIRWSWRLI